MFEKKDMKNFFQRNKINAFVLHSVMHIAWPEESHRDEEHCKYHNNGNVEEKAKVVSKPLLCFINDGQNHSHNQEYIPTDEHFSFKESVEAGVMVTKRDER